MTRRAALVLAWLALGTTHAALAAPLTEAEKQLLSSTITQDGALQMGKTADAAAFARIIATGDSGLVSRFGSGMSQGGIKVLPPDIEALVVRHFDDPRVGAVLRELPQRYATRALFDRYYALAQATYRANDPVFRQILNTDQAGIEAEVLRLAPKFSAPRGETNPAISYLSRRKYPGVVPTLVASIEGAYRQDSQYNHNLSALLAYEDPEVWRLADAEVKRLKAAGKIPDAAYLNSRQELDRLLADPPAALARRKADKFVVPFRERRALLDKGAPPTSLRSEPARYLEAQARHIASLEALAAEMPHEGGDYAVAHEYASLGLYARFKANDPARAIAFFEKGVKGRSGVAQLALADTYQLALRDSGKALRVYQQALEAVSGPPGPFNPYGTQGSTTHAFWKSWFAAEIEFLRTGKPFQGSIPELAIKGFWDIFSGWRGSVAIAFPEWPVVERAVRPNNAPTYSGYALGATGGGYRATWTEIEAVYAVAASDGMFAKLPALPASRLSLMVALRHISALNDPARILAEMARHDPSGYWTTIILGTVAYHERTGRDGALADGTADRVPGMGGPGNPNALAKAARQFMDSRKMGAVEKK